MQFQEMLGWGGTTTPPAFAELSPRGAGEWWRMLAEYNLLLHREYPTGALLNPEMTNWDRPADASPHYYGDNFPNCETSDFEYMRKVRRLGGQVVFEFWELPPWARARDAAGKLTDAPEIEAYVKAMVRYCQVSREKIGNAPEIVGIQNEVTQSAENWRKMALALRQGLDAAGFAATKIHMHNAPTSTGGVAAAQGVPARPGRVEDHRLRRIEPLRLSELFPRSGRLRRAPGRSCARPPGASRSSPWSCASTTASFRRALTGWPSPWGSSITRC